MALLHHKKKLQSNALGLSFLAYMDNLEKDALGGCFGIKQKSFDSRDWQLTLG